MISIAVAPHPLLDLHAFTTTFSRALGDTPTPPDILALLKLDAPAPFRSDEAVRDAVRQLLRHGGFKPAGRSKPASEYLIKAVGDGALGSINAAVDICNIVSLHSGLPISVVDLAKAQPPFRVAVQPPAVLYVFNASGQSIDLTGLLCLEDAAGPCGNAVKDAQRTKTDAATCQTLTVMWGANSLGNRAHEAETWYRKLLRQIGAVTADVERQ